MILTWGRVLSGEGHDWKYLDSYFWLVNAFSSNQNRFSTNILERDKALRSLWKFERMLLKLVLKDWGVPWHCLLTIWFTFIWRLIYSLKKRRQQKKGLWFWNRWLSHLCTLVLRVDENFMQSLFAFFGDKNEQLYGKLSWSVF